MNERLFRTQFNQMDTTEKQALMESLAARYGRALFPYLSRRMMKRCWNVW